MRARWSVRRASTVIRLTWAVNHPAATLPLLPHLLVVAALDVLKEEGEGPSVVL
jgi:hypothetical protein